MRGSKDTGFAAEHVYGHDMCTVSVAYHVISCVHERERFIHHSLC